MRLHRLIILAIALLLWSVAGVKAQSDGSQQLVQTRFLKDSIVAKENVFYYNSLSITNISGRSLDISLLIEAPCFLNIVSSQKQLQTLAPGESTDIPVRFTGNSKNSCSAGWLPVNVTLSDPKNNLNTLRSFAAKPDVAYKWRGVLLEPAVILSAKTKSPGFVLKMENNGNVEDSYRISFVTKLELSTGKKIILTVKPGQSVVQDVLIKMTEEEYQLFEQAEITIIMENNSGEKKMLLQKISRIESVYKGNIDPWQRIPLTLEWNFSSLLRENPGTYLRAFGTTALSKTQSLNMNFQTPTFFKNGTTLPTGFYTFFYNSPKWQVTAGTISDFGDFSLFGTGVKLRRLQGEKGWIETGVNKSSNSNVDQAYAKMERKLKPGRFYTNSNFVNADHDFRQTGFLTKHGLRWINPNTNFSVTGGAGVEKIKKPWVDTLLPGYMAGVSLQKTGTKIFGNGYLNYYSTDFPGINKGFTQYYHDFRTKLSKRIFIGTVADYNSQQPGTYRDSFYRTPFNYRTRSLSGLIGFSNSKFNLTFMPGTFYQLQDSVNSFEAKMKRLGTNLYITTQNFQISFSNSTGMVSIPQVKDVGSIFSMSNYLTIQSLNAGLVIRYDIGPYYYFELKDYLKNRQDMLNLQATPFVMFNFPKYNLETRTQVNMTYSKPINDKSFSVTNNIGWQNPKKGLGAGLVANVDFIRKNNTYINLYIRKNLNLPVYKKYANKNIAVVLFRDKNGDGKKDTNELPVVAAQVMAENALLQTDENGQIKITNFFGKMLNVDLSSVNNVIGWIPSGGYKQQIPVAADKVVYIPFKKAKQIIGKLTVDRDLSSELGFEVANIRLTALGRSGTVYTTLTGGDGTYYINVLDDEYTLSINQNVFDENFKVIDPVRTLDLVNNQQMRADFLIKQKRREIKIKRE